jgi:O-antigen ligase
MIVLLGLAYGRQVLNLKTQLFAWLPFVFLGSFLVRTGSRGAMLSLAIGVAFFVVKGGNIRSKIGLSVIVLIGLMALVGLTLQSDILLKRFEMSVSEGNVAGRDVIFIEAAGMVNEKPLLGWGYPRFRYELANRLYEWGGSKDTHNLYLMILVEVGILGGIPFFLGIGFCVWGAWKARYGLEGSLPLSMVVTLLMINMSLTWDNRKIFWIILAYGLVSARHAYSRRNIKVGPYSGQRLGVGFSKSPPKAGSPIVVGQ